jgi:outer membrane protein OmpA-like peptidoglycan-associated protein
MPRLKTFTGLLITSLLILPLTACHNRSKEEFNPGNTAFANGIISAGVGAGVGAAVGSLAGNTVAGAAIGGAVGTTAGFYQSQPSTIIKNLNAEDIQYVTYGESHTLIIPTDKYYKINSPQMSAYCPEAMTNVVRLLKHHPHCKIYVAAFTDDIGSDEHKKKLSQAQAETMVTYLWAHDIPAEKLSGEGYADKHAVSDNQLIHGSAQNRRIEIQWACAPEPVTRLSKFVGKSK